MLKMPVNNDSPTSSIFDSFDCESEEDLTITDKMSVYKQTGVDTRRLGASCRDDEIPSEGEGGDNRSNWPPTHELQTVHKLVSERGVKRAFNRSLPEDSENGVNPNIKLNQQVADGKILTDIQVNEENLVLFVAHL